jgi:hypothetical protein
MKLVILLNTYFIIITTLSVHLLKGDKMHNNKEVITKLFNCAAACEYCADACLNEDNIKMLVECIRLDKDCADICRTTANFLSRDSKQSNELLRVCADICRACAEECEKHDHHDHCIECARACRECEEACRSLVS